ncbi:Tim17/Tim22/Tim23/Pmp24 family protein [Nitzschia inconspicua]|uniref:Tim17/Tim22/Tim23/Pmp24 family protein n=1 Tax=Nitzschia inconspicua TaxID=303405 RepID=A0A9K3M084_9STRA|nr:Tim17/Tim22/Tim23/Pmp24 family protein [Nitzschia inconspicua]
MTGAAAGTFWPYRNDQYSLGKDNGLKSFGSKAYYAALQGGIAGVTYGALQMAYYPDKMAFSQKGTVTAGPARGLSYISKTTIRPAVVFSAVTVTFAAVESVAEEIRGSHYKDPWNSAFAGAAAGLVLGGFLTRRIDVASMTALGTGLLMGMVDFNGPSPICDPMTEQAKHFPPKISPKFEESEELKGLKAKYPDFKNN